MANEQETQTVLPEKSRQMFQELADTYIQAAGEAVSSILKADIKIRDSEIRVTTLKEVEYGILEPAIFVKTCLTSQAAGNVVIVLRQRDMQVFLNELMGIDDLPDPDFVFDDVAMSAAGELMNQMVRSAGEAMAEYLGSTIELSDCQLVLSEGCRELAAVMGESSDAAVVAVNHHMKLKGMVESEFIECLSPMAMDSLVQEMEAKEEADLRAKEAEEAAARQPYLRADAGNGASGGQPAVIHGTGVQSAMIYGTGVQSAMIHGTPGHDPYLQPGEEGRRSPEDTGRAAAILGRGVIGGNLGLIMDVPLNVSVEIGKTRRTLKDVLNFNNGTVVELDKQADAPVDIIVNGQLIARGEVVVIDDNFGVRVSEIVNTKSIIGNGEPS